MNDNNTSKAPDWEMLAAQLRKPSGEFATEIGQRMNTSNLQIHQFTFDDLQLQPGFEVLEIGMGNGHFVSQLFQQYPNIAYTGIDYSEAMVTEAKAFNTELSEINSVTFLHGTVEDIQSIEAIYDHVFTINTLYFWSKPLQTLAHIHRLLKPGGKLTIAIRPKHIMEKHPFTPYGFTLYSKEDVCQLLEKHQFNIFNIIEKKELASTGITDSALTFESLIITAHKQ